MAPEETVAIPVATFDVFLHHEDLLAALRRDALDGLSLKSKAIPSKWFYDAKGSALFDEITRLPEYYLTRAEREILIERSAEIAGITRATTLVELGSGTSEKTRLLLRSMRTQGLQTFMPFDVDEHTLRRAADNLQREFPGISVHGIAGDFEHHLQHIPADGHRMIAFLGSTIGNLTPPQRAGFLNEVSRLLSPGEWLLLGIDLVKDPSVIVAAYNDAQGVSSRFNLNVLDVLNAACGADFDTTCFSHVAEWDEKNSWMSMWIRSNVPQTVTLTDPDLVVSFAQGELLHTEISTKFKIEAMKAELASCGLAVKHHWTDLRARFGLLLAQRA